MKLLILLTLFVYTQSQLIGSTEFCSENRLHNLDYNVKINATKIYDIDQIPNLADSQCDIDGSRIKLTFSVSSSAEEYLNLFSQQNQFITGTNQSCPLAVNPLKGFLMRSIKGAQLSGNTLTVLTAQASYTEVFEQASINYTSKSASCKDLDFNKHFCIGWNTDDNAGCNSADHQIPIFANSFMSIKCDNCYVGLEADIFFNLEIGFFKLKKLQAGFQNAKINSGLDVSMFAEKNFNTGVEKDIVLVPKTPLVQFKVAEIIPVSFWFEIPAIIQAEAQLSATATMNAGVDIVYDIGDAYVQWDPTNHWTHVTPTPQFSFTPKAAAQASFQGTASLKIAPTLQLNVNQLFQYNLNIDPQINLAFSKDSTGQKICEDISYDLKASGKAELDINIDWLNIHEDKVWGPTTYWSKSGQLSQACFAFALPENHCSNAPTQTDHCGELAITIINNGKSQLTWENVDMVHGYVDAQPNSLCLIGESQQFTAKFSQSTYGPHPKIKIDGQFGSFSLELQQNFCFLEGGDINIVQQPTYVGTWKGEGSVSCKSGAWDHRSGVCEIYLSEQPISSDIQL